MWEVARTSVRGEHFSRRLLKDDFFYPSESVPAPSAKLTGLQ